jgi:flagellar motor switch protein FliN/FliY
MSSKKTKTQNDPLVEERTVSATAQPLPEPPASQAAALLMGVKLPIRVLLGRVEMCLRDVAQLGNGSVVELDCAPEDPVDIIVNDRVIAHGEVVVVGGNYGVRITQIPTRLEPAARSSESTDLLGLSERLK